MRDTRGAIVLARKTIESEVFSTKPDKWFKIWIFLLITANYKDNGRFRKGESFTTYSEICSYTKATRNEVDHCIRWLKLAKQITTRKATRGFFINIVKYNVYQTLDNYKSDTKSDTKSDLKAIEERHRGDTIKKKEKKEKKAKNTSKSPTENLQGEQWNQLIDPFEKVNPMFRHFYKLKTERHALNDMVKEIGFEKLKWLVEHLKEAVSKPYAPKISKPTELKRDMGKLIIFWEQEKQKNIKNKPNVGKI
jgi:hypothetical protein